MKKLFRTLILCMLIATISVSAFACGKEQTSVDEVAPINKFHYEGTHIQNKTEIPGKYLVKDGKTNYVLVVPANNSSRYYLESKDDFVILFERATGITLSVATDDQVEYTSTSTYISLGATKLVEQAGIPKEEYSFDKLGEEGVRILTKGESIFLLASDRYGGTYGVIYSVYVFMEIAFNYDLYYRNCLQIDTGIKNYPLYNYDVLEIPDIPFGNTNDEGDNTSYDAVTPLDSKALGLKAAQEVKYRDNRFRDANYMWNERLMYVWDDPENPTNGRTLHNILPSYIGDDIKGVELAWKSDNGQQACFTAHGDAQSLERFVDHCVERIKYSIKRYTPDQYPQQNTVGIFCSDGSTSTCMCDACTRYKDANNGAWVSSHIVFVNKVADKVQAWLEENKNEPFYRDEFDVIIFGYGVTNVPPVYFDETTGEATATSDEMYMHEGAGVYFVGFNGFFPMYDKENDEDRKNLIGWNLLTDDDALWVWQNAGSQQNTLFADPLSAFDNDYYEFIASQGTDGAYVLDGFGNQEHSAFLNLRYYIGHKLRWNVHYDINVLKENYAKAMYGEAWDEMLAVYDELRIHFASISDRLYIEDGGVNTRFLWEEKLWPYKLNLWWYNALQECISANDHLLNEDPTMYEIYKGRIEIECIAPLYNIMALNAKKNPREFTDETLVKHKRDLYEIVRDYPDMVPKINPPFTILEESLQ